LTANLQTPIAGCMRWGKWGANFSTSEYNTMIERCLYNGITSFDHADIYGDYTTEEEFGKVLKSNPSLRSQMQLITKCGIQMMADNRPTHAIKSYNTSKQYIIDSVERSLQNFHTDYIDVLLIHRPDPLMNPHEIAEAIHQLKEEKKILHFGVSNFLPKQVDLLKSQIEIEFNQVEISILYIAPFINGVLDHCYQHNIIPMAWAPLGGGILTDDGHPRYRAIAAAATPIAANHNTGINQVLVAWLLMHPSHILPVVGTTKLERLLQVKEASTITLTKEEWFQLYAASLGEDIP
jgi:predicted oxidoreductase